jgi:hypothetical protein
MEILAHVDGTDMGAHHLLPLLAVFWGSIGMYLIVFWATVRDSVKRAAAWVKKLFTSGSRSYRSRK